MILTLVKNALSDEMIANLCLYFWERFAVVYFSFSSPFLATAEDT